MLRHVGLKATDVPCGFVLAFAYKASGFCSHLFCANIMGLQKTSKTSRNKAALFLSLFTLQVRILEMHGFERNRKKAALSRRRGLNQDLFVTWRPLMQD